MSIPLWLSVKSRWHPIFGLRLLIAASSPLVLVVVLAVATIASFPVSSSAEQPGAWRLGSASGQNGQTAQTLMRAADWKQSDPDLAGISIRCGENKLDVVVMIIDPFPPRSKPEVIVTVPGGSISLDATVLPTGAALLLSPKASELANGQWQSLSALRVQIRAADRTVSGTIPVDGLAEALKTLQCNSR